MRGEGEEERERERERVEGGRERERVDWEAERGRERESVVWEAERAEEDKWSEVVVEHVPGLPTGRGTICLTCLTPRPGGLAGDDLSHVSYTAGRERSRTGAAGSRRGQVVGSWERTRPGLGQGRLKLRTSIEKLMKALARTQAVVL